MASLGREEPSGLLPPPPNAHPPHLDIRAICWHEFLIDVGPGFPDAALWGVNAAPAANLKEARKGLCEGGGQWPQHPPSGRLPSWTKKGRHVHSAQAAWASLSDCLFIRAALCLLPLEPHPGNRLEGTCQEDASQRARPISMGYCELLGQSCGRKQHLAKPPRGSASTRPGSAMALLRVSQGRAGAPEAVSYTHLTLPTKA